MPRNRKTRKRKGGFKRGQLVQIKWFNQDGSFNWWDARIIDDNGGRTIIVHWLGLYTNDGFPLHQEIQRPGPGYIRILSGGGTRKMRKMKGGGNFSFSSSQEPQHRSLDELNPDDVSLGQTIVNILMQEDGLTRQDAIDETVNAHDYDVEVWNRYIQRANRRDQPLRQDMLSGESKAENPQDGGKRKMKGGHHLYKRLGVSKYASQKQIRKAFKTLKKKRKANKKVKEAYKILSNKKTRKQYNNRYRKAVKRGGKRKTRKRKGGKIQTFSSISELKDYLHQQDVLLDGSEPREFTLLENGVEINPEVNYDHLTWIINQKPSEDNEITFNQVFDDGIWDTVTETKTFNLEQLKNITIVVNKDLKYKYASRGGKRKTRRRKGGNENCYGFKDLKDSRLCNDIHLAAQYYDTSRPEKLSTGQKIARKIKNRTTRRNNPKPESPQQVAQQKRETFLEFKDKLHPVLGKLKEAEDKIRAKLIKTIEGPDDPMGEKQRELEAEYDEAFSKTNEKLMLMKEINANLNREDKCPLPAQIEKARNDYSNRGRIPLAPRNVPFNVSY